MRINILLCDTFPGLLPNYIPSYVSMFTRLFDAVTSDAHYEVYRAMDGSLPEPKADGGIYIITGCNQSVYDDTPWIRQLLRWIVRANEARACVCGICFGHQAVAQALGGTVQRAPQGWGVGIRESHVVDREARLWFSHAHMRLLYNHHDQVTAMPRGARLVATSDFCPIEAMRIGGHILTFQGHPEYVPDYERHLLNHFAADEPEPVKRTALQSLDEMQHDGETVARWVLLTLGWASV